MVVTALVGLAAGWATTPRSSPSYQSTSVLFVGQATAGSGAGPNQATSFDQLLESYCLLFPDGASAARAAAAAGEARSAAAARRETAVVLVPYSDLLRVTVTDPSPSVSARLSDAMAAEMARVISSGSNGLDPLPARVVAPAATTVVGPPGRGRRLAEDAVLGFFVGVVLLVGWELVQGRIRRPGDVEARLGLPVLAILPYDPSRRRR